MRALLSASGVDTVRFRWREDNVAYLNFLRRPEGTIEGYRGERFVQTPFGRIGAYHDGLFYMEGRAAALANADSDDHTLLSVDDLPSAERVAHSIMVDNGCPLGNDPARLGRIDLASELRFSDGAEGSAFLHSLSSLDVPWAKTRVDGKKGSKIETVSFHGTRGKTIYLRAYDKGVESGTAKAGQRIRMERQKRFRKTAEPSSAEFQLYDLRKIFWGREFAKLSGLPTATVCDVRGALEALCERCTSYSQLERLAGYVVVGGMIDYGRSTLYSREGEMRSLGIFIDPATQVERLEVPVGEYLQTLGAAWAA
jgi:hypothetical protein